MRTGALLLTAALIAIGFSRAQAASSGNPTHDGLLAQPPAEQAKALAKKVGKGCVGTSAFPMGVVSTAKFKSLAYWSVSCQDGRNFAVQIAPDAKGTAQVADCRALEGSGKECFKKL